MRAFNHYGAIGNKDVTTGFFWCNQAYSVDRICSLDSKRVKVSENLGATGVAPVAPVVTSLWPLMHHQSPSAATIQLHCMLFRI